MRTLKKSLCLVLALVMVLGLCVIGTNAAYAQYTDKAKIDYVEAVEVLTGLEVIEGYPDGSFNPTANVTRAEAAAMIARMMLGREKADKLPVGDVKFSDVPETNWAAKYIAFCANRGIIVGMGDGTFRPAENITGTQMATMLLRALGYGVMGEYEGKGWDINAVADALYYKLFEDSKVTDFNQPATREETALYVWNTMRAEMVGYDVDLNYYDGKGTTFARIAFNLYEKKYTQVLANQATGEDYTLIANYVEDDIWDPVEEKWIENWDLVPMRMKYESGLDLIGHEVTVYYQRDLKEDKVNHVEYYECYLIQDNSTILDKGKTFDDFYRNIKTANKSNVVRSGEDVKFSAFTTWTNYDYEKTGSAGKVTDFDNFASYATVEELKGQKSSNDSSAYISGTWILDHEGKVLVVLKTADLLGKVLAVDTDHDEVEIKAWNSEDKVYFDSEIYDLGVAYEGIAKNDYAVIKTYGKLFEIQATHTEEVTISQKSLFLGSWYFNNFAYGADGNLGIDADKFDDVEGVLVGDTVLFYLTPSNSYFALEVTERAGSEGIIFVNYAKPVTEHTDWGTEIVYKVQCVNQDGKEVTYVCKNDTVYNSVFEDGAVKQGAYEVRVNSDGKATAFISQDQLTLTKTKGRNSYIAGKSDNYYVTSDTKVIYINGVGGDMEITVASKLAETGEDYNVYAVSKKSGAGYSLNTVWLTNVAAPADYSNQYLYIGHYANNNGIPDYGLYTPYEQYAGYDMFNGVQTPYFTVYIDGVTTYGVHIADDEAVNWYGNNIYLVSGFYQFKVTDKGLYVLDPVDNDVSVTLKKGDLRDGKLYIAGFDGVEIKSEIIDLSRKDAFSGKSGTTADTKTDANVNSVERIEELLNEGYEIGVDFVYTETSTGNVPFNVMYVYNVIRPEQVD